MYVYSTVVVKRTKKVNPTNHLNPTQASSKRGQTTDRTRPESVFFSLSPRNIESYSFARLRGLPKRASPRIPTLFFASIRREIIMGKKKDNSGLLSIKAGFG